LRPPLSSGRIGLPGTVDGGVETSGRRRGRAATAAAAPGPRPTVLRPTPNTRSVAKVVGTPQLGGVLVHYDAPNGIQFTNAGPCSIQTALISSLFHFLLFTDVLLCLQQWTARQEKCTMNRKKLLFRMCGPQICGAMFGHALWTRQNLALPKWQAN